jgi:tetratricopeptide (TPR) repeat protein
MVDANVRAMLARLYVINGDNDKAIPVLAELVKQEPGWQDGALLLVEAYSAAGRGDEAIAWLEQTAPDSPSLYATLGSMYERRRQWVDAAEAYEKAPQFSRSVDMRVRYASMLLNAGGVENAVRARDALRVTLTAGAKPDERVLQLLSQAERVSGDLEAAETAARQLIAANPRSARGYVALAESLEERRRYQPVIDALAPAVQQLRSGTGAAESLTQLLPHLGFAYQQLGQFDQAIAAFEEARTLSPRDLSLTGYLIQSHLAAKHFDQAAELARQARAGRPTDLRFARLEAQALVQAGRADQGITVLEEAVRLNGGNPEAHIALAQVYAEANRGPQAVKVLQDAQSKFPGESAITFQLGAVFEQQKKYAEAESAFRQIIASEPDHAAALNYLGYMLADRGEKLAESMELIKRALAIEPDNGSYLDSLGWAYYRAGQLDLAEQNLRRAAGQLATNSVIQDHYGDVLIRLGRASEAIAAWNRALEGDGDSIDLAEVRRKIKNAQDQLPRR